MNENKLEFHWIENTWTFSNKKQIPVSIEKEATFYFIYDLKEINQKDDSFLMILPNDITSKKELLDEYYIQLKFPFFGFNWDALRDSLLYLENIKQKKIRIYHQEVPKLKQQDIKIYLDILRCSIADWKKYKEHDFEVYFNMKDYDIVQQSIG
jgi:hypothetical protein